MRLLIGLIVAIFVLLIAIAIYLAIPVFKQPPIENLDAVLTRQASMLDQVPADASEVVLVPAGGATIRRIGQHAVTGPAIRRLDLLRGHPLLPWLIGGGDLVIWRAGSSYGAVANPDRLRRFLAGLTGARVHDGFFLVGPERQTGFSLPAARPHLSGHLFLLRDERVGAIAIEQVISILTVSPRREETRSLPHNPIRLPEAAMVAAAFASTPPLIRRIEQTLPVEISPLLEQGAVVALYQLHDERLLPRPRGVIVVQVTDQSFNSLRRKLEKISPELPFDIAGESRRNVLGQTVVRRESIGFTLEYTRRGDELLVAFDKSSVEQYLADQIRTISAEGTSEWLVRFDPRQLTPALGRVSDHTGLRIVIPELARAVEDLYEALQWVEPASEVLAIQRLRGESEELEITISPP